MLSNNEHHHHAPQVSTRVSFQGLKILEKEEKLGKSKNWLETQPATQYSFKKWNLGSSARKINNISC